MKQKRKYFKFHLPSTFYLHQDGYGAKVKYIRPNKKSILYSFHVFIHKDIIHLNVRNEEMKFFLYSYMKNALHSTYTTRPTWWMYVFCFMFSYMPEISFCVCVMEDVIHNNNISCNYMQCNQGKGGNLWNN